MIEDLDKTLAALLKREAPGLFGDDAATSVAISFATPDDQFPPSGVVLPAVDLFLYDVRENWELRSNEWGVERDGSVAVKTRPPARVDCSYLITAWTNETAPSLAEGEHRLLGQVMKALLRHRKLPADILRGALVGQTPPVRAQPLQPGQLQSLGEFWQALGGKPKAAINYKLTISVDLFEPIEVPIVEEKVIDIKRKEPIGEV